MSFILDGKTADELNLELYADGFELPIAPDTRDRTINVIGRDGSYDFGADLGPKRFELPVRFKNVSTKEEVQEKVRELNAVLFDSNGKPKTVTLSFNLEADKYYEVRYSGSLPIQRLAGFGWFTLPLIAYDPSAYSDAQEYDEVLLYDDGHEYDTGLIYPNAYSFNFQYQRQLSSLYNYSKLETPMDLEIQGSFSNLKITNESTGQVFQLNTNVSSETVVIDMEEEIIKIGQENGLKHHEGDFIFLQSGENKLVFEAESPNATVTYNWKHKF